MKNDVKTYLKNNLTSVWKVIYDKKQIIAFFTISMNGMEQASYLRKARLQI
ncbi:MAG: hypothetical protein WAO91_02595 [Candidatus Nitrosotenuis sp.]